METGGLTNPTTCDSVPLSFADMARLTVPIEIEGVYDVEEAARLSGRGVATVWRWIRDGKIVVIRINGRTLVPESEIEKLKSKKATG